MTPTKQQPIHVWDLPTRIFHWLLVTLIVCAWASYEFYEIIGDTELFWHRMNGYAVLIIVIWRLLWGLVGSPSARFANFLVWPTKAAQYGIDLVKGRYRHFLGHNPLGSYMIIALLGLIGVQSILGLMATEDSSVTWGPLAPLFSEKLSEWFGEVHGWFFENVLIIFIAAHIIANVLYRVVKKDPLIEAMIIGTKPSGDYEDLKVVAGDQISNTDSQPTVTAATASAPSKAGTLARAFISLCVAIAIFVSAIKGLGGNLIY